MKRQTLAVPIVVIFLGILLAGCNLPISPSPTPFVFPTPNYTMTAIFNPPVVVPPTVTPPAPQEPTLAIPTAAPTETATAIPVTPTATVSPTSVPVSERPGASASAAFLSTAPDINGSWDEWKTTQYPLKNIVFGRANWKGAADLEGAYRVGWDGTYLYVAVKVTDDVFAQNATGDNIYKGDSIEILLDTNLSGDSATHALTGDDYQIGITAGKGEVGKDMEAHLWYPSSKAGNPSGVKMAAISMSDGYRIEAAIPWTVFGVTPANGQRFGFVISISDNDKTNENVQQTMASSDASRVLTDPTTWGNLTLTK